MITKKWLALMIMCILIIPSISLSASSLQGEENEDSSKQSLIEKLLEIRFRIGYGFFGLFPGVGRWFVYQIRPPVPIQAHPGTVNLEYLNETTIIIGGKIPGTDEWEVLINIAGGWDWAWMTQSTSYEFEFVPPEGFEDVWIAKFDPKIITLTPNKKNMDWPGALTPFKTNLTLKLNPSADPNYPTQDVILKVNVIREEVGDLLRFISPPTYPRSFREEYLERTADQYRYFDTPLKYLTYRLISWWTLMLQNFRLPAYDRYIENTVEILINVTKDHYAQIIAPPPMEIQPYQLMSIPVTIKNLGSHIDTFNFRVSTTDNDMIITPPPVITLKPGEEDQIFIGVAAPKEFLSVGATRTIQLEAYSIDDPENVFKNTIILSTTGIHVSGATIYHGAILLATFFIIVALLLFFLRKRREKICKKPEKPWTIPEENKYLEKLKQENKKIFEETMKIMQEEYQSSLLWHKHYCRSILQKRKLEAQKERQHIKDLKKKAKAKEMKKEKIKKEVVKKEKEEIQKIEETKPKEPKIEEIIPEEPKIEEKIKPVVDEKAEMERRRKEQALLRIKREQEKQKRKVGSSI